jgi:hypothetical protein
MNIEQLVEDLRYQDCFLSIDVQTLPDKPAVYVARFWYDGAGIANPWAEATTFNEAIRLAAIRVIAQCNLDVTVPRREPKAKGPVGFLMFIFWVSVGLIGAECFRAVIEELSK